MRSASTLTAEPSGRRWLRVAAASADRVANQPELWLPGGLAWLTTIGWIPFVAAIVRPPSVAEVTYLGAGFTTSGLWPFNVIALAAAAVVVVVLALALSSAGNTVLISSVTGARPSTRDAGRLFVVALIGAVPVALCVLTMAVAAAAIGPAEFNRPGVVWSPILGIAVRIMPILILSAVVVVVASTLAGLAGRAVLRSGSVPGGLTAALALGRAAGRSGLWHLAAAIAAGLGYLALSALLLGVLWAPIRSALESGAPLDLAGGLLLVGFVAIWLCLVLAGGAVHAWASVTATVLLSGHTASNAAGRSQEMPLDR